MKKVTTIILSTILMTLFLLLLLPNNELPINESKVHLAREPFQKLLTQNRNKVASFSPDIIFDAKKMARKKAETLTIEEKVGQLFLARVPEANAEEDLAMYHLGGYLLFSRDIRNESQESLKNKIVNFQNKSALPLFIGSDEEGGSVSRLSYEKDFLSRPFDSPQKSYLEKGLQGTQEALEYKASVLQHLGINLSLSPVADVSTEPNSFIYERTIGKDTAETTAYIADTIKKMKDLKLASTLKHFPGYGNNKDSHLEIARDNRTLKQLEKEAFPPFIKGIEAGANSILISHILVEALDKENPASISPRVYSFLREELGFEGVIMTDDFDMAGLNKMSSQEDAAVRAIKSGADLILSSSYQTQIPAVLKAVREKKIEEKQLNDAVTRLFLLKWELGILKLD